MKCWNCNEEATITRTHCYYDKSAHKLYTDFKLNEPVNTQRCYCQSCYDKEIQRQEFEEQQFVRLKKRRMLETAIRTLEKQHIPIYRYKDAIKAVEEYIEGDVDKFDSSYEMIAAIVLIHNKIRCKLQYKIGRYQVDMLLPDLFVALEIDGERHKGRKEYDSERDLTIKMVLGSEWEIVRIKTDYLDQNATKLLSAIKQVCDYRAFKE